MLMCARPESLRSTPATTAENHVRAKPTLTDGKPKALPAKGNPRRLACRAATRGGRRDNDREEATAGMTGGRGPGAGTPVRQP